MATLHNNSLKLDEMGFYADTLLNLAGGDDASREGAVNKIRHVRKKFRSAFRKHYVVMIRLIPSAG